MSNKQPFLAPLLAFGLLVGGLNAPTASAVTAPPPFSLNTTAKIHPLLQYGAVADPTAIVRVIVQTGTQSSSAAVIAAAVHGQVVESFNLIPAFVMDVPQALVATLAANPNVRYVSPDGPVQIIPNVVPSSLMPAPNPPKPQSQQETANPINATHLQTTYPLDTGASTLWSGLPGHVQTGAGTTVAVIDSGIDPTHPDFAGRLVAVNVNKQAQHGAVDGYGHGTHVAGIIGGRDPAGQYLGMAPNTTLISVKVSDDGGSANESDLLRGFDWVETNRGGYHIQALNLSVSVGIPESYATSPIDAAVERLWHDNVTVVAAAGNLGSAQDAVWYAPGNDPLVITVGCIDENATAALTDDSLCPISSRGVTEDGFAKPDLVAPGRRIVSALAAGPNGQGVTLGTEFADRVTADGHHIRLSGTSMAAPIVVGAIALLLERQPGMHPDQIKQLLLNTSHTYTGQTDKAGVLDVAKAMLGAANPPNQAQVLHPVSGVTPPSGAITLLWDGARWGSTYFDGARWGNAYFDGARWGAAEWDGARWGSAYWDGARWGSAYWDGARWGSSATLNGARWGSTTDWDGARWGDAQSYD